MSDSEKLMTIYIKNNFTDFFKNLFHDQANLNVGFNSTDFHKK